MRHWRVAVGEIFTCIYHRSRREEGSIAIAGFFLDHGLRGGGYIWELRCGSELRYSSEKLERGTRDPI